MPRFARVLLPSLLALFSAPVVTADTAENAIKYRKFNMSAMAAHTGALSLAGFGRVEHADHAPLHAKALADLVRQMRVLFPEGSGEGDTDALPLIWEEPEAFAEAVDAAEAAAGQLETAAATGDRAAVARGFKAVGESCKGCHDRYRRARD